MKRAYEPAESEDGIRIFIDRLWPRGVSKAEAALDDRMLDRIRALARTQTVTLAYSARDEMQTMRSY